MDMTQLRQLALLIAKKRRLESELRSVKGEISSIEDVCINEMITNGIPRLPLDLDDGSRITLYLDKRRYAKPKDHSMLARAFEDLGMGDLVKTRVNPQTLNAYVREYDQNGIPLPTIIDDCLEYHEDISIRGRIA